MAAAWNGKVSSRDKPVHSVSRVHSVILLITNNHGSERISNTESVNSKCLIICLVADKWCTNESSDLAVFCFIKLKSQHKHSSTVILKTDYSSYHVYHPSFISLYRNVCCPSSVLPIRSPSLQALLQFIDFSRGCKLSSLLILTGKYLPFRPLFAQ